MKYVPGRIRPLDTSVDVLVAAEIIQYNVQDTIFGGFVPNSKNAEALSKALDNRTVMNGTISRGKSESG